LLRSPPLPKACSSATKIICSNDDNLLARRDELPVRILKPAELLTELICGGADDRR
jgi:predicted nucleic acid-binding protein